jgi:holo-[acyl-carrier protein] synthase
MLYGIGTDLVEVDRMEKTIALGRDHLAGIFTPAEIDYCESMGRKSEHYAARFAAKEAFFKAMGTGWRGGVKFAEVEIINDELGKPHIRLYGKVKEFSQQHNFSQVSISLSHVKDLAVAVVIIENG